MKAIVLTGTGIVDLLERPEPEVQERGDAIVRVTTAGICGSDLHILHGRDPGMKPGTIMGHEFTGTVEAVGEGVTGLNRGDRVAAPFTINCGECFYCLRQLPARCIRSLPFGFVTEEGTGLQGAQAELVRVPLASSTLLKIPDRRSDGSALADEEVLFLGDILSTAYSCAEGAFLRKADVVVVVGCGPVGLLCILTATLFEPAAIVAIDTLEYRLDMARSLGAVVVRADAVAAEKLVRDLTEGRGADAALEAVGSPSALDLAIRLVRPGAAVSIAGYHTEPVYAFPIHQAYEKNLSLRIGRCNARKYMQQLLPVVLERRLPITSIISHILPLEDGVRGYEIFDKRLDSALKVLLKP